MAEFSKQWCYMNDPEMPHDFDIEEIADAVQPDYYKSFICEGFGFTAIGKDHEGKTILYFPSEDLETGEWKDYEEFIKEQKRREW